jgi:hypothetical protein
MAHSEGHRPLDGDMGRVLGRIADYVCDIWRRPDSGIWEVRNGPFHFTHSKVMCWVALDRARRLAERGELPARHIARWKREAAAIEAYVESECWSDALGSYTRTAGDSRSDASLLMLPKVGYGRRDRISGTIDAIMRELREGDFVYRYHADDGVPGGEGCFLNCSFWLVSALARVGRVEEATALMERLLARANDVGLHSEEIEPGSGEFRKLSAGSGSPAFADAAIALTGREHRRAMTIFGSNARDGDGRWIHRDPGPDDDRPRGWGDGADAHGSRLLLGTIVTEDRREGEGHQHVFHFLLGLVFALMYLQLFVIIGRSSWWLGALLGRFKQCLRPPSW